MSFLRRLLSSHPSSPDVGVIQVFGGGLESGTGLMITPETAESVSAVFAAIRIISETLGVLPCQLYHRLDRGKEQARDHPLYRLLQVRPNPWQTPFEFKEMMGGHLALRGMAFAQKVYLHNGHVGQLIPLHPDRVKPRIDAQFGVVFDYSPARGGTRTFLPHELLRLISHTTDGVTGRSPIAIAKEAVGLAMGAEQFGAKFFGNNAQIAGILKHPGRLSTEAKQRLRNEWQARYGGTENAGKMAVLEEGLDWTAVGMKNDDAQFLETRKFQVEEIARIYRIPPHKLQSLDKATFSNIEHQSIEWVVDCVLPWVTRVEQALGRDLLEEAGMEEEYFFKFSVDALLRGDQASRAVSYATGRQWGWLSANDIRELEDMNPLPGEQGDVYLTPTNMQPAGTLAPGANLKQLPGSPIGDSSNALATLLQEPLRRVVRRECQRVQDGVRKHGAAGVTKVADQFEAEVIRTIEPVLRGALAVAAAAAGGALPDSLTTLLQGALTAFSKQYTTDAIVFWQQQAAAGLPDFERVLAQREAELPAQLSGSLVETCARLIAGANIHQAA